MDGSMSTRAVSGNFLCLPVRQKRCGVGQTGCFPWTGGLGFPSARGLRELLTKATVSLETPPTVFFRDAAGRVSPTDLRVSSDNGR